MIESAREELHRRSAESATGRAGEFAVPTWERAARISLFSAEIDAQFHKARCSKCKSSTASQPPDQALAEAA